MFVINVESGVLTNTNVTFAAATPAIADAPARAAADIASNAQIGFDFNNSIDAARIVSNQNDNLVFFPSDTASGSANAGNVLRFTDLFYAPGDINEGTNPLVFANAYTNAVDGATQSSTVQYAIDANTDTRSSITTVAI